MAQYSNDDDDVPWPEDESVDLQLLKKLKTLVQAVQYFNDQKREEKTILRLIKKERERYEVNNDELYKN